MNTYNIAVIGATEVLGEEITALLEARNFPAQNLRVFASEGSAGSRIRYKDRNIVVELLTEDAFEGIDLVFFSSGSSVSRTFAPHAVKAGAIVIDASDAFCLEPDVPLVVPEVNPHAVNDHRGILAPPNRVTVQLAMALQPIHDEVGITRVVVSTYQAVSGTGGEGVRELETQTRNIFTQRDILCQVYPHQIAFNCLPHIGAFQENGSTKEELNIMNQTRKVLEDDSIRITATAVRVPVFYGHSAAVNIETEGGITAEDVRQWLAATPGITVIDDPGSNLYPLAIEAVGEDAVFVGRIREDTSVEHGIHLWITADNLRKGTALNAVQIAELLVEKDLL